MKNSKKKLLKNFKDQQKPQVEDAVTKLFKGSSDYVQKYATREQMVAFVELFNTVQEDKIDLVKD
ncbi:hypothetical protein [Periweissella beninensis]|uniref:Uncharacterized protein n=1 Tax=Periweissella beninensis TaxID=504936 RepID=A0ABT0VHV4_9LACO|nr:hypothetical protein [Periweissella beninensis]MBM7543512.1 hypothetical protein [Periweissella beninensis]MCM2436494.1 hypothetical protein [Periweissella beninensis]MCT4396212.1 hypothetical protein [Periweissella beninensis]